MSVFDYLYQQKSQQPSCDTPPPTKRRKKKRKRTESTTNSWGEVLTQNTTAITEHQQRMVEQQEIIARQEHLLAEQQHMLAQQLQLVEEYRKECHKNKEELMALCDANKQSIKTHRKDIKALANMVKTLTQDNQTLRGEIQKLTEKGNSFRKSCNYEGNFDEIAVLSCDDEPLSSETPEPAKNGTLGDILRKNPLDLGVAFELNDEAPFYNY